MNRILIPAPIRKQIAEHAVSNYPREACGVLLGRIDGSEIAITQIQAIPNTRHENDRFTLDPRAYGITERDAAAAGMTVVGFFHSHPDSPAIPSKIDLEDAQGLFEFTRTIYVYAIQSTTRSNAGELAFWRLNTACDAFEKFCS